MAAFGGTTQKCKACNKTVYFIDQLTADNRIYHKSCFRCHHCKGTLKLSNYNSFEGVPYCRPHYDQLFKMTGSLDKSFEGAPRSAKADRSIDHENHATSRLSNMFSGTQDKCVVCKKTVYPLEKVAIDGNSYHKACFKCSHGGCVISLSNYITHEGKLYCKHHHTQLFMARGDFRQLEEKHENIAKVPFENPAATIDFRQPEDKHEDVTKVPSENPVAARDFRQAGDKHEDTKVLTENSMTNKGVEDCVEESI